jgi:hypothetical protein
VWEPNERDAWVADAQRWIARIKGVKQCRINLDDQGEIEEILVVAGPEKEPRKIVRDVETLLKARLNIDVYYKKISVTQLIDSRQDFQADGVLSVDRDVPAEPADDVTHHDTRAFFGAEAAGTASEPEAEPATGRAAAEPVEPAGAPEPIPAVILAEEVSPRITCANVGVMASDMVVRAEVQLCAGELEALGTVEGPNHADSDTLLVARATVEAISQLLVDPVLLHVKEVRLEDLGGQTVVLTAIDLVEGRRSETLFGACSAHHNRQQAVVHAVLDALNRRLSLFGLKSARAEG